MSGTYRVRYEPDDYLVNERSPIGWLVDIVVVDNEAKAVIRADNGKLLQVPVPLRRVKFHDWGP